MKAAFYKETRPGLPGIYNRLVRWWTKSPYSHVELVVSTGRAWSSSFEDGGVRSKLIDLDPAKWDLVDLPTFHGSGTFRAPPSRGEIPLADVHWHGLEPYKPDFGPSARYLAYCLDGRFTGRDGDPDYRPDNDFYMAMNVTPGPLTFTIPPSPTGRRWRRLIDTAAASPDDFIPEGKGQPVLVGAKLTVAPFGMLVLISEP